MTMKELREKLNSTPSLRARFEEFNQVLEGEAGGACRREGSLVHVAGKVGEGEVQEVSPGLRGDTP